MGDIIEYDKLCKIGDLRNGYDKFTLFLAKVGFYLCCTALAAMVALGAIIGIAFII